MIGCASPLESVFPENSLHYDKIDPDQQQISQDQQSRIFLGQAHLRAEPGRDHTHLDCADRWKQEPGGRPDLSSCGNIKVERRSHDREAHQDMNPKILKHRRHLIVHRGAQYASPSPYGRPETSIHTSL